jgi:hypothetical protein
MTRNKPKHLVIVPATVSKRRSVSQTLPFRIEISEVYRRRRKKRNLPNSFQNPPQNSTKDCANQFFKESEDENRNRQNHKRR